MSRRKKHELRSEMFKALSSLVKQDRSQIAEWERDLVGEANCAIWDGRLNKLSACLRRLMRLPERGAMYKHIWELFAI